MTVQRALATARRTALPLPHSLGVSLVPGLPGGTGAGRPHPHTTQLTGKEDLHHGRRATGSSSGRPGPARAGRLRAHDIPLERTQRVRRPSGAPPPPPPGGPLSSPARAAPRPPPPG